MLLETALADFSEEKERERSVDSTSTGNSPVETPVESPGRTSSDGASSFDERQWSQGGLLAGKRSSGSSDELKGLDSPPGGQSSKTSSSSVSSGGDGSFNELEGEGSPTGSHTVKRTISCFSDQGFVRSLSVQRRSFTNERWPMTDFSAQASESSGPSPERVRDDQLVQPSTSSIYSDPVLVDSPIQHGNSRIYNDQGPVDSPVNSSDGSSFQERMPLGLSGSPAPVDVRRISLHDPSKRGSSIGERRRTLMRFQDSRDEEFNSQDETGDNKVRQTCGQFFVKQNAPLFEWAASPGKPAGPESPLSSRSRRPASSVRTIAALRGPDNSGLTSLASNTPSPPSSGGGGTEERVKSNLGARGPTCSPHTATTPAWSSKSRDDVDRDSSSGSDDGSGSETVSRAEGSPLSLTYSPMEDSVIVRRPGGRFMTAKSAAQSAGTPFMSLSEMSEELPSVMEEDEEDLESVSGFHTIEFQATDSPRGDWSFSGRAASSKSLSAPNSLQGSSLRPGMANRGRRRSDFDWPEDFDDRPEEVVKEVDDSLWAFSPVASTFVFSGNEASPSLRPGVTNSSTPRSSPGSGSVLEQLTLRRGMARSALSSKTNHGVRSSVEGTPYSEFSGPHKESRFRHRTVNGDDDFVSASGTRTKKSFSCLPFFSLCSSQRPTPRISFSQRLSPPYKT